MSIEEENHDVATIMSSINIMGRKMGSPEDYLAMTSERFPQKGLTPFDYPYRKNEIS
jgi:hypothetical protein